MRARRCCLSRRLSSAPIGERLGPVGAVLQRSAGRTEVRRVVDLGAHRDIPVVDSSGVYVNGPQVNMNETRSYF